MVCHCEAIKNDLWSVVFDVTIDKMYEASTEEVLKFIVRILTINVSLYYSCRCIICNNLSVEGLHGESRRGLAREYCVNSSTNFNAQFSLFINNMFVTLLSSTCFEH